MDGQEGTFTVFFYETVAASIFFIFNADRAGKSVLLKMAPDKITEDTAADRCHKMEWNCICMCDFCNIISTATHPEMLGIWMQIFSGRREMIKTEYDIYTGRTDH